MRTIINGLNHYPLNIYLADKDGYKKRRVLCQFLIHGSSDVEIATISDTKMQTS